MLLACQFLVVSILNVFKGQHPSILSFKSSYDAKGGIIIEHKTWNMREAFCFPGYGCPTEIAAVQIKPQWQAMQLEDSLRLMGIYHITAHVRFDFQDMQAFAENEDLITIDALDIQGDTGYFEYAVPLHGFTKRIRCQRFNGQGYSP